MPSFFNLVSDEVSFFDGCPRLISFANSCPAARSALSLSALARRSRRCRRPLRREPLPPAGLCFADAEVGKSSDVRLFFPTLRSLAGLRHRRQQFTSFDLRPHPDIGGVIDQFGVLGREAPKANGLGSQSKGILAVSRPRGQKLWQGTFDFNGLLSRQQETL